MKRIVTWALALTLALGLFSPGVAQAHIKDINTRITIKASDTRISRGQRVTFSGALKAPNRRCIRSKRVTISRRGTVVARARTDNRGKYAVRKALRRGGRYRVTFGGFVFGVHPHVHTCEPSADSVRIRIA